MMSARPLGAFARLFQRPLHIASTNIFARRVGSEQVLAYAMHLDTAEPVAMVLPIPVTRPTNASGASRAPAEDAVTFVDLSEAHTMFADLAMLFDPFQGQAKSGGLGPVLRSLPKLVVHTVGSFDASFVPCLADFARLDERFRLADSVWRALPRYDDWGFVVVKLRKGSGHVHPIAFRFETRDPARLFFPTVHVHDGSVHAEADFDHSLYFQGADGLTTDVPSTIDSDAGLEARTRGLVGAGPVKRRMMRGRFANDDVWI